MAKQIDILNPYTMIGDAQNFIGTNKLYLTILVAAIAIMAAYMLYEIYASYTGLSAKERGFRRGKSSIAATLRVEIIDRMKRKRKPPV